MAPLVSTLLILLSFGVEAFYDAGLHVPLQRKDISCMAKKSKIFGNKVPGAGSAKQAELLKMRNQARGGKPNAEKSPMDQLGTQGVVANPNWRDGGKKKTEVMDDPAEDYGAFQQMLEDAGEYTHSEESYLASSASKGGRLAAGDLAPLDVWNQLKDVKGDSVTFSEFKADGKPIVVIVDPRRASGDLKSALLEINSRFPETSAKIVAISCDKPSDNRKLSKKSMFFFPLLADTPEKTWMDTYGVLNNKSLEKVIFIIEPKLGKVLTVLRDIDSTAVVETIKDGLTMAQKRLGNLPIE
uniref:Alkyl hydroperoxide reductase subunit C/ Thiol specific antioxidant domain-containing protein n=1 Tax=Fibrocapsa japonica TaxID=94617 RepID=A0A7S2V3J8_9STRA|mmetsp:Transcript_24365/g.35431  ORF Transcript_24365/g.35431 Transcript_24365/m.35431 type:complete len:298 (+) Transcript_24365:129-1022(+)|eukprot:CAMPEP_0113943692 /NCGR_PEP_ID=MMETSP1339-20121228/26975_1 /TAXON_ID=94617 /ORGANISM="Fibrocapsa japonica" /LENGTH=297 /DNA_ID=CAMNT_0000948633 /DNA_START=76 /DNA_END=969 /DNA_ORIENTATION=+ /assembly_acc=CAM_ASM_000762